MTLETSAFYLNWKDMQLLTEINGFNVTGNAGAARSTGLELAWTWRPGSYTNAEMTSDAPQIGAKSGDQLPDSPKLSGTLYVKNVGDTYGMTRLRSQMRDGILRRWRRRSFRRPDGRIFVRAAPGQKQTPGRGGAHGIGLAAHRQ